MTVQIYGCEVTAVRPSERPAATGELKKLASKRATARWQRPMPELYDSRLQSLVHNPPLSTSVVHFHCTQGDVHSRRH
jgi:hypothetical protein